MFVDWLMPATVATLSCALVLVFVYLHLYVKERVTYLLLWGGAWFAFSFRLVFDLLVMYRESSPLWPVASQVCTLLNSLLLLWGTYNLAERRIPSGWLWGGGLCTAWLLSLTILDPSFQVATFPIFAYSAMIHIAAGVIFLRVKPSSGFGQHLTGGILILWGCHKLDYPLLRPVAWFAPWGFLLASVFALTVAIGTILVYFQRTRMKLQASEEGYRSLLEQASDGIFIANHDGRYTAVNTSGCEMTGYSRDEILQMSIHDLVDPDELPRQPLRLDELYSGKSVVQQRRLRRGDGSLFEAEISAKMLGDGRLLGIVRDITSRNEAEAAVRRSEERFRAIAETAQDAIFVKDQDRRYTFVNPAMQRMFGRKAMSFLGHTPEEIYEPSIHASIREVDLRVLQGEIVDTERTLNVKGQAFTHHTIEVPLCDSSGKVFGMCGIVRDISAIKQAEEKRLAFEARLQHAQKLESLGVLAGGIAHDFNNLLVGILGNVGLALEDIPESSPAWECLDDIQSSAKRAAELCRQMLAYSGKGQFVIEAVDLSLLIREIAKMLEVSISKKASLRLHLQEDLPPIEADATQIRQVVMNLIINASEALENETGTIRLVTGVTHCEKDYFKETYLDDDLPEGNYVFLEVSDTGCGMEDETRKKLFEPFFTTKFTGRGLGLAAVLGIVRGHQGAIKVYSEPDKGTVIRVLFPEGSLLDGMAPEAPPLADGWRGEGTVLLVDDEVTVRAFGKRLIERLGFDVLLAADGVEGVEVFRQNTARIVCVILDLTMPRMDGEECLLKLRAIREDVPVILSSGYNQQEVTQRFVGSGLAGFMQKPYQTHLVAARLRGILEKRSGGG